MQYFQALVVVMDSGRSLISCDQEKLCYDADGSSRYGYLTAGDEGVWVVDLSDPAQPELVGRADTPGCARGIAVVDDLAYVGDDHGGLLILHAVEDP